VGSISTNLRSHYNNDYHYYHPYNNDFYHDYYPYNNDFYHDYYPYNNYFYHRYNDHNLYCFHHTYNNYHCYYSMLQQELHFCLINMNVSLRPQLLNLLQ